MSELNKENCQKNYKSKINKMKKLLILFIALNFSGYSQTAIQYYNNGIDKYDLKDYVGAIADFNKAIEINPNDTLAYYSRGASKYNLQDYRGAVTDLNKAIELNPYDQDSYCTRGSCKDKLKDHTGAIADFNKAISLNPNDALPYYNRGVSKNKLQDYRGAIEDYNKAIGLNPNDADAYYNRGTSKYIVYRIMGNQLLTLIKLLSLTQMMLSLITKEVIQKLAYRIIEEL
jgi:tetratricopeptide (TPR) repeat protein